MGKIINLFGSKKIIKETNVVQDEAEIYFQPGLVWEEVLRNKKRWPLPISVILEHEVTYPEMCRAIALATILTKDTQAIHYFIDMVKMMPINKVYTIRLELIPPSYRGYVWNPVFKDLIKTCQYLDYNLSDIVKEPITRHIFL